MTLTHYDVHAAPCFAGARLTSEYAGRVKSAGNVSNAAGFSNPMIPGLTRALLSP